MESVVHKLDAAALKETTVLSSHADQTVAVHSFSLMYYSSAYFYAHTYAGILPNPST